MPRGLSGPENSRWKGGKVVTYHGYVRITAGPDRFQMEHWVIVERLRREQRRNAIASLLQTDPQHRELLLHWLTTLEEGDRPLSLEWEIHHIDTRRAHNCPGNLLRIDAGLHAAFTPDWQPRKDGGRWGSREKGIKGKGSKGGKGRKGSKSGKRKSQ